MCATMKQPFFDSELESVPKMSSPEAAATQALLQASFGYVVSACLNVAIKLGIPERIGSSSKTIEALAEEVGAEESYLLRLLRVLEANNLVTRVAPRTFALTEAGRFLRRDTPGSMASLVEWLADPLHFAVFGHLKGSVETGTTTFDAIYKMPFFDWLSLPQNSAQAEVFHNAMTGVSASTVPALLEVYPFHVFEKIVDVGGGHGLLLRSILLANAGLKGVVADLPSVISGTKQEIMKDGLADRCEAAPCNFFESVPVGGDCYLMKNIIHDWAEEEALRLLQNIRAVIPPYGKLILVEMVIDDSPTPHPGKLLDIEMMAFVGGRERTEDEYRNLLARAGFNLENVLRTKSPMCLLESSPA